MNTSVREVGSHLATSLWDGFDEFAFVVTILLFEVDT